MATETKTTKAKSSAEKPAEAPRQALTLQGKFVKLREAIPAIQQQQYSDCL